MLAIPLSHVVFFGKKTTAAILAEEVCSQDLQDTRPDYGESETGHAVIGAAYPVRLARCFEMPG